MTATDETTALPLNLHEYEAAARELLPPMVWEYVAGGSGDQVTLRGNRAAFDRWRLLPRVLRGLREVSTATTILGQPIALPVLIAPSGRHRLCHDEGERATARAARAAGTIYTMSTAATLAIEEVAPEAGSWWFQLYVYRDRGLTRELVLRAAAAGASALVVTVDVPMRGRREAEERTRFAMPPGVATALLAAPEGTPVPAGTTGTAVAAEVNAVFDPALNWDDLDWLASLSPLPILLKGVLHPGDAARAIEYGTRVILVSNHGGRQLDGAVAALDALPAVVEAVADRAEVIVDGGVRRGTDILKALALGARAVLIGRPVHWGLAVGGEAGVRHVLELLRAELALDLMLCGLASPLEVDGSLIVPAGKR
ncbi:MAG TPA: alpha-hydroxy acid oxidase [Thermomicrobiales bacterium]|nr:alpha-hydroxy acid oxidase [Thermomicrobiales bacterium]